jgi:hypothetical protein
MTGVEIFNISGGLIILASGLLALLVSFPDLRKREFLMFNLGIFFILYGLRWLIETPGILNTLLPLMPRFIPYSHSFLTYLIPIPFSAFLLNFLGRGIHGSMRWFFISTIVYAVAVMIYDLFSSGGALTPSISIYILAFWCLIGGINVVLIQEQNNRNLMVLKVTLSFFFLALAYDNLVTLNVFPWSFRLEHIDILVLFTGMVYIAVRRYRAAKNLN